MITVFTPTYNRAYLLENLYNSLCSQSHNDFEWLIVDDGSTDNTKDLVNKWIDENIINIRYYKQENGGKHRAINRGVSEARGELFFIVDSDDSLLKNSLEIIENMFAPIRTNLEFAGIAGLKGLPNGKPVGNYLKSDVVDWYMYERRYKYDMSEVYRTEVMRNYPFPDFPGEKFCPESLIWNRIGIKYKVRYFNQIIYKCDYLDDGLTKHSLINRRNSPSYITLLCKEELSGVFFIKKRIKAAIYYWRFWLAKNNNEFERLPLFAYIFIPLGLFFKIRDDFRLWNIKRNKLKP